MFKHLRSFIFIFLFGIGLSPFLAYSQSPVISAPIITSGPIKVSTANLLDVTIQGFSESSKHKLQVVINYAAACDNQFLPASILTVPELTLDDLGKIPLEYQSFYDASWEYADGNFKQSVLQTGFLPEGCYEVCYTFTEDPEQVTTKTCIQFTIEGSSPFYLLTPFDGTVIEDPYPILSWTPYESGSGELLTYQLTLTEYFSGQSPIEGILSNTPRFQEKSIDNSFLQYPITALPLDLCRHYAWKVDVLKNDEILVKSSEIWTFSTKCEDKFDVGVANNRYHFLTDDADNIPFNLTGDTLRMVLNHPYQRIEDYRVSVESLHNGSLTSVMPDFIEVGNLEENKGVNVGENLCFIDLKALGFIPGEQYLLKANNQNSTFYLYFQYHKP